MSDSKCDTVQHAIYGVCEECYTETIPLDKMREQINDVQRFINTLSAYAQEVVIGSEKDIQKALAYAVVIVDLTTVLEEGKKILAEREEKEQTDGS